ncbi:hypothetical protein SAFG77S_02653 [Streptomyces afghaniensis]
MICVDEFGPLNLMPRKGKAWGPVRRPRPLRATYNRYGGVRHTLAALDLATGRLYYRIRPRKRWRAKAFIGGDGGTAPVNSGRRGLRWRLRGPQGLTPLRADLGRNTANVICPITALCQCGCGSLVEFW